MMLIALAWLFQVGDAKGPIGKFNDQTVDTSKTVSRGLYDVERCVINAENRNGAPFVYRQPDRPDDVTIIWVDANVARARVDLQRVGNETKVTGWHTPRQALDCL